MRSILAALAIVVVAKTATAQDTLSRGGPPFRILRPTNDAQRADVTRITAMKRRADSMFAAGKPEPRFYARVGKPVNGCAEPTARVVRVAKSGKDVKWPENHTDRYAVLSDSGGHVLSTNESPDSCSGDWNITYVYYFDSSGRTVAFDRYAGFFNGCSFGLAREKTSYFFDAAETLVAKEYSLTNGSDQAQKASECKFAEDPYVIRNSWTAYANVLGVPVR